MSTKAVNQQQQRRTPLSLTGGASKTNQSSGKSADTNGNSNNGASAKNDNKQTASQKVEPVATNNADTKESTTKEVKKPQNTTDKRQTQQQNANSNEATKKNEKVEEKKTQNGASKAASNGGAKEKQQNGSEKQENGNGNATNTRASNTNANSNVAAAKTATKTNEKNGSNTAAGKEETKAPEQKPSTKGTTRTNEKAAAAAAAAAPTVAKEVAKSEEQNPAPANEKNDAEKKKESAPEKVVEKETRSRRNDAATVETEKKSTEKVELPATRSSAAQQPKARGTPTKGLEKSSGASTPTRGLEKTSGASTPTKGVGVSPRTRAVTTAVDDVEMEELVVELSPEKSPKGKAAINVVAGAVNIAAPPAATSTPGKPLLTTTQQKTKTNTAAASKSEIPLNIQNSGSDSHPDRTSVPRTFGQIGGRRSIRPLNEYTPSKFQSNLQYRESYRRINTELDVSSTTNTSMNVTVGSEVPNNSSFSFFGLGRKRDRTPPPQQQSTMELHTDADYSPPKRARYDMQMFFNVVSSPLTLLRSRFSKTSIQSSTPVKFNAKLTNDGDDNDEAEVQNVSGISIEEEQTNNENAESVEKTATEDVTVGKKVDGDDDATPKQLDSPMKVDDHEKSGIEKDSEKLLNAEKEIGSEPTNVHEVAAGIADTSVALAKKERCNVM